MVIRGGGAAVNIVLNVVLVFGFGMGVVGAAIGTAFSIVLITVGLVWGLLGKPYSTRRPLPAQLSLSRPYVDPPPLRSIVSVSTPIMFQQLARTAVAFPLLAIADVSGSVAVAGYEIVRRTRDQINSLSWGSRSPQAASSGDTSAARSEECRRRMRRPRLPYRCSLTSLPLCL